MPASGATVSGTAVTVSATASDNIAVAGVRFMVDDYKIADEDISAPYSVSWSTQGIEDGSHTLTAVAYDTSGNTATTTRTVTVSNGSLTITNVSPSSGPVGTMVIITGTKLDMTSSLQFNQGGAVSYTIMSPTQIRATVPAGSQTGGISINFGQATYSFTVTAGSASSPAISSIGPLSGPIGSSVVITGRIPRPSVQSRI